MEALEGVVISFLKVEICDKDYVDFWQVSLYMLLRFNIVTFIYILFRIVSIGPK